VVDILIKNQNVIERYKQTISNFTMILLMSNRMYWWHSDAMLFLLC